VNETAPSAVFSRAASGMSEPTNVVVVVDAVVEVDVAELEVAVEAEVVDSTGGEEGVVHAATAVVARPRASATHAHLLRPRTRLPLTHP
jgi:hypothetical protein